MAATVALTYDQLADPAPVAVETHFPRQATFLDF